MKCLVYVVLALGMLSCRGTEMVFVPRVVRDSVVSVRSVVDSVYVLDSVNVDRRSDTVYSTRMRTMYRSRVVYDTLQHVVRDTVSVVVPVGRSGHSGIALPWWFVVLSVLCIVVVIRRWRK